MAPRRRPKKRAARAGERAAAVPQARDPGNAPRIRTTAAFLRALQRSLKGSEYSRVFGALRSDFENSVANVVLNRLIGAALGPKARALEPAYQGHQYYPFPALRIGPSLSQVLACSHLCEKPVALPLLDVGCLPSGQRRVRQL